ncbi:hypothetical protein PanWU01x14_209090, partial [Parasponia andersonii]
SLGTPYVASLLHEVSYNSTRRGRQQSNCGVHYARGTVPVEIFLAQKFHGPSVNFLVHPRTGSSDYAAFFFVNGPEPHHVTMISFHSPLMNIASK